MYLWVYIDIHCAVCFIKLLSNLFDIVKVKSKSYTTAQYQRGRFVHILLHFFEWNVIRHNILYYTHSKLTIFI